ncbi:MAG: cyclic-di-AMP receptor [Anaerolineae bacterium]
MKVIFAITSSEGAEDIADVLREKSFRVTLMSSIGGFLRRRNTTLMIGVKDEQVDEVLEIIRQHAPSPPGASRWPLARSTEQSATSVAVFVLNMSRFEHYQP